MATSVFEREHELRAPIMTTRHTLPRVVAAAFACPLCNWPLIGAKFSSCTAEKFHEEVFELACSECGWQDAILGRVALGRMILDWNSGTTVRLIYGA
jgi:transcription elongation factor Elf1